MKALPVKISQIGNSLGLIVPKTVERLFDWEEGMTLRIKIVEGGPTFERPLTAGTGGRYLQIIVTKEIAETHGIAKGDTVEVPFHEWEILQRPKSAE